MQTRFVFADLEIYLTLTAADNGVVGQLSEDELLALQQVLYMGLTNFMYVRALYAADQVHKERGKNGREEG